VKVGFPCFQRMFVEVGMEVCWFLVDGVSGAWLLTLFFSSSGRFGVGAIGFSGSRLFS